MTRTPFIHLLGMGAAFVAAFILTSPAQAGAFTFFTLDNDADPAFNQLLGINNAGTIAGYFGDGSMLPNKGYTLAPPYGQANYTNENFPGSVQTQVVGINSNASPATVGFWIDGSMNNFGFTDSGGTFTSVSDPNVGAAPTTTQLLGVNNGDIAAGFYVDAGGNAQGFLYNFSTVVPSFTSIMFPGATATTASGVNNAGVISGFYVDVSRNTHGFIDNGGTFTSYDDPNGTDTMFLGLNNDGQVVGSYVDSSGETEGLLLNLGTSTWQTISDPFSSDTAAFGVTGTTVNGLNDNGQLVGFYSDGTNVNGFIANPVTVPEPASLGLMLLGAAFLAVCSLTKSRST